jgi:hypothetical protein
MVRVQKDKHRLHLTTLVSVLKTALFDDRDMLDVDKKRVL